MKSDVVIVGGGIIGLYSAYLLALDGVKLTLIDRGELGQESTWAAGGILSPLLPWDYSQEILFLTNNACDTYQQLAHELQAKADCNIEYWQCGLRIITDEVEMIQHWCRQHHYTLHVHAASDSQTPLNQLHLPDVAQVRTPLLINGLVKRLQTLGVKFLTNTQVTDCCIINNKLTGVKLSAGKIDTSTLIWATGAWTPSIHNDSINIQAPNITPIKGQVIALKNSPITLKHILFKQGHYLIPRKDGLILAGSTLEDVGYEKTPTRAARDQLWKKSLDMMPELASCEISHHWTGLRPGSIDNIPTIGPHPGIDGLFFNCGHFRYGLTMAPTSCEILTKWILDDGKSLSPQERYYCQNLAN